jgi:hypothetical protein
MQDIGLTQISYVCSMGYELVSALRKYGNAVVGDGKKASTDSKISNGAISGFDADLAVDKNAKERFMAREYS